jgi:type IV pilus assembly protein PilE
MYNMDFSVDRTADTYVIRAVPQGDQANDRCGTLTLDQAGVRTASGGTVEDCWSGGR